MIAETRELRMLARGQVCSRSYKNVHNALQNSDDLEIALQLGNLRTNLRFIETHRQDIRTILQNERDK